jgi:Replication-relaxation
MNSRRRRRLSARDLRALAWIGEGYEVGQYQLEAVVFAGLSPTVASRFVRRAFARGLVAVDRLHGIGMNRLRLTAVGRETLASLGYESGRLFAPRRPVALKDLAHTLAINDLRVVLATQDRPPTELLPAWMLQRQLSGEVVPDLLAVWRNAKGVNLLLACEVDRGTENLASVFLPKLRRLAQTLRESAGERTAILVLTEGRRRMELLNSVVTTFDRLMVEHLPQGSGAKALAEYRERLLAM